MLKVLNTYNRFFKEYKLLLLAVVMTVLTGIIAGPVAYVTTPLILIWFSTNIGFRKSGLLFFFFILIMSDSLLPYLQAFKIMRIEAIVILFIFAIRGMVRKNTVDKNVLFILPFIASLFVSLMYSPIILESGFRTLSYLFLPIILFELYKEEMILTRGHFIKDIILLGSIFIIIGHILFIVAPAMVRSYGEGNELRISGVFGNPNGLAIFSFLLFPITLYLKKIGILKKSMANFLICLLLFSVIISGSRSALGAIFIFSAYWISNAYQTYVRLLLKSIIPVLLFLFVTVGVQLIANSNYLSTRLRLTSLESAGGRLEAWEWGYEQVPKKLYFGGGLLYDNYAYDTNFSRSFRAKHRGFNAAFSAVLALLMDAGVIGMAAFILFIFLSFSKFQDKKIVIPLFLAMLISWTFESWIIATLNPFTILFFIQILAFQYLPLKNET